MCDNSIIYCSPALGHVRWVPSHHGLEPPKIADGEDSLPIWSVAANISIRNREQPKRGGAPAWGLGRGLTTAHLKNNSVTKCHIGPRRIHLAQD
jgi:hypothetical protein